MVFRIIGRASVTSVRAGDDRLDPVGVRVIERLPARAGKAADRDAVLEQAMLSARPYGRPRDAHCARSGLLDGFSDRRRATREPVANAARLAQQLGLLTLEDRRDRSRQAVER